MSVKTLVTCDHCSKDVPSTYESWFRAAFMHAANDMHDIHACSKEHLGYAVAKAMGVPVDGTVGKLMDAREEIERLQSVARSLGATMDMRNACIAELETHAAALSAQATQYKTERDHVEETCRMHSERVIELEKQLSARREPDTDYYYNAAFDGVDYGKVAYERFRELPATPKDAASWDRLKGAERNEWRAIVEPVVERVRAEKSRPSIVADNETIERFAVIVGENGGESLSSAEMERIAKAVIETITDTTKPTKPAMAVEEPEARLEVKQTKWVCVEEGRAKAMREAWQKAISNGDNARVIFADGSQES